MDIICELRSDFNMASLVESWAAFVRGMVQGAGVESIALKVRAFEAALTSWKRHYEARAGTQQAIQQLFLIQQVQQNLH